MGASTSLPRALRGTANRRGAARAPSDRELLESIPDDRTEVSLQTLYRRYCHQLYGFAYRSLGDRGAADELVQDVFTSVWRHAESYDRRRGTSVPGSTGSRVTPSSIVGAAPRCGRD
jgi:Sigma-70 region 2